MIDDFLAALGAQLRTSARTRARILDETRDHLVDSAERLEFDGVPIVEARARAIAAFGDPATVALEFNAQAATTTMRRTPAVILAYAVVVVGGFLATAVPGSRASHATSASIALRVVFFAGTLGVQVAFVAGLRAASIVAARWRESVASTRERRVVHASAVIAAAALSVTASSWSVACVLAFIGGGGARTLVAGAAGLGVVGALGALACVGLARQSGDDSYGPTAGAHRGLAATGERLVDVVHGSPRIACAVVAVGAGLLAMHGAESTPLGALPSGAAEVVTVVAAFLVLGPRLGLRDVAPTRG